MGLSLFWFGWAFWSPFSFFPPPVRALLFWFGIVMSRARTFPCTVSVDVSDLAAQGSSRPDVVSAIVDQFGTLPIAAVQFFGTEAKVTFERPEHKRSVMQHQSVCIRGWIVTFVVGILALKMFSFIISLLKLGMMLSRLH